ncbi:MAG: VCBS repeat-containing protein [Candidatus Cloacimonetes bacterium]|nr:VCBS repeat-containing protein [Candidatus Cloacimonadota bacterium]
MKKGLIILCWLLPIVLWAEEVTFTEHPITAAGSGNPGLYAADLDGDGDNDIVASVSSPQALKWWRNDGDNTIMWTEFHISNDPAFYIYAEDMNNDQHTDILATCLNGQVAYWKNSGDSLPSWEKVIVATGFTTPHGIYACDIDNDSDMDILATSAGLGKISWFEQENDTWTQHVIATNFPYTQSVYAVNIDNDDDIDVLGVSGGGNELSLWYNLGGDPISWQKQLIDDNFRMAHWVTSADIDGDDNFDILGAAASDDEVAWWKNGGGFPINWTKYVIASNVPCALTTQAADLDRDGDLDVIANAWATDDIIWWEQEPGSPVSWVRHTIDTFNNGTWPIVACDIDNDNAIDIVTGADVLTSGGTSAALTWWENSLEICIDDTIHNSESGCIEMFPNPFSTSTTIRYFGKLSTHTSPQFVIYNIKGQLVRALSSISNHQTSFAQVTWDGNDYLNRPVCSGLYYNILLIDGKQITADTCLLIR